MDRRKAELYEPSRQDLKDTECTYNDADFCMGLFNPIKLKLKTSHGYTIINDAINQSFQGMRDRYRGICLIKAREGDPDRYISMNFFGEIGYWKQLPKADQITDYTPYLHLTKEDKIEDEVVKEQPKKPLTYSF